MPLPLLALGLGWLRAAPRVKIERVELASGSLLREASVLSAEGLSGLEPESYEVSILAAELSRELMDRFSARNRGEHALFVAHAEDAGLVGICGIDVQELTSTALSRQRAKSEQVSERPLLTNLAVRSDFRRRGIAKQLCRECESIARSWGYGEVLLKVEKENSKARRLYERLGYRSVALDAEAERPDMSSGRLLFVSTTQLAMRKDLRFPPFDTVFKALALLILASIYYPAAEPVIAELVAGRVQSAFLLAVDIFQSGLNGNVAAMISDAVSSR